jgi:DNA-binding NarL/FixJ family response regulator
VTGTVLIVDDHRLLRQGLRSLLEERGFEVVGEAEDGRSAVKLASRLKPSAIIMDISMPELNGIDAMKCLHRDVPGTRVIIMSMHRDSRFVVDALEAGAAGYVLKDAAFEEVATALESVLRSQAYLSPAVAGVVIRAVMQNAASQRYQHQRGKVSCREREVLQLLAEGRSTAEIAGALFVSAKTVETHRKQLMDKLGLRNIPELTKYAIREGLTSL